MPDKSEASLPSAPLSGVLGAPPPTMRDFADVTATRQAIFDGVLSSLQTAYPVENARYRLELHQPKYTNEKPFSLADQKKAVLRGLSLSRPIRGTWRLVDKGTGQIVDEKSGTVAHVPYLTERGTFVYNGSEYTVANQMRLRPGVFSRVKDNGVLEAHFNVRPGTGPSFKLYMEPSTGIFRVGVGQSELKLYPILRAIGVPEKDIEAAWGRELLQKNQEAEDPRAVSRAFAKLVATRADQLGAEAASEELGVEA